MLSADGVNFNEEACSLLGIEYPDRRIIGMIRVVSYKSCLHQFVTLKVHVVFTSNVYSETFVLLMPMKKATSLSQTCTTTHMFLEWMHLVYWLYPDLELDFREMKRFTPVLRTAPPLLRPSRNPIKAQVIPDNVGLDGPLSHSKSALTTQLGVECAS